MKRGVNQRKLGGQYEQLAASFLEKQGLRIQEKNFRCRMGEIDLIARDGSTLVFVEVKYRTSGSFGDALSAVDKRKQIVLGKVAKYYLMTHCKSLDVSCRFDVVGIEEGKMQWIKNAFDYVEGGR